ncbi:hypothetical protein DIPPA_14612 [Diplonema papillatum]|nr:hypothetical protein DIPPA_14612 [Diplonema papillatum]
MGVNLRLGAPSTWPGCRYSSKPTPCGERFYSVVDPISRCQRAEERQQELEKELGALAAKNASLKERCAGMNRRLRASIQWRERTDEAAASTLHSGASTISLDGTLTSIDGDSECAEMADVAALVHHQQRVPPTLAAVSALDAANRRL